MRNVRTSAILALAAALTLAPAAGAAPILNTSIKTPPYDRGGYVLHFDVGVHETAHAYHGGTVSLADGVMRLWARSDNLTGFGTPELHCIAFADAYIGTTSFECVRTGTYRVVLPLRWCGLFGVYSPQDYTFLGGASAELINTITVTVSQLAGIWLPIWSNTIQAPSMYTHYGCTTEAYDGSVVFDALAGTLELDAGGIYAVDLVLHLKSDAGSIGVSAGSWAASQLAPIEDFWFCGTSYTRDGYVKLEAIAIVDTDPDESPPTTFIASGAPGGSYDHPVSCTLGAGDGDGYGVQAVSWRLGEAPWQAYELGPPAAVINIAADTVLSFYGVDKVGNVEPEHQVAYRIRPANTWRVPLDAPTIQAGIDSAAAGDTVVVACGAYHEHAVTLKSGVAVRSASGQADCATVDGDAADRVFSAAGVTGALLKGFTITNGRRSWGAGLQINGAAMTVENCVIRDNVAYWPGSSGQGGGLEIESCSPTLRNLTVVDNTGPEGGGLALYWASPVLENCIIAFNDGVSVHGLSSSPALTCCDVYGNTGGDWVGAIAGQEGVNGNLSADPLFCTWQGTHDLDAVSPCLPPNNGCGELIGALGEGCAVVAVPGAGGAGGALPPRLRLTAIAPNPFNPRTVLRLDTPTEGRVRLEVYDVRGKLVRALLDADLPAGSHEAAWDGTDRAGRAAPSGAYFARLSAGGKVETARMSLVR